MLNDFYYTNELNYSPFYYVKTATLFICVVIRGEFKTQQNSISFSQKLLMKLHEEQVKQGKLLN